MAVFVNSKPLLLKTNDVCQPPLLYSIWKTHAKRNLKKTPSKLIYMLVSKKSYKTHAKQNLKTTVKNDTNIKLGYRPLKYV